MELTIGGARLLCCSIRPFVGSICVRFQSCLESKHLLTVRLDGNKLSRAVQEQVQVALMSGKKL